jgi:hypothetical protein
MDELLRIFGVLLMRLFGGWMRRVGVGRMPCVASAGDREEADEERDGGNGKHGNGTAEAGAYLRGGAGSGVAAHAAALCVGSERAGEEQCRETEANEEKTRKGKADAAHACAYWKKTSRLKRKTQKMPMECQYQAVQSTKIWRSSMR